MIEAHFLLPTQAWSGPEGGALPAPAAPGTRAPGGPRMELQGMQLRKLVLQAPWTLAGAEGVGLRGCSLLKGLWY